MNNTTTITKNELSDKVLYYFTNIITSDDIADMIGKDKERVSNILGQAKRERDNAKCYAEGRPSKREEYIDSKIGNVVDDLMSL